MDPAPDLNLIIAPAYAWMYYMTGDTKYRDWGDQIFAGGVTNAQNWLYLGKQFDQNYWWSPAYVTWRKAAQPGVAAVTVPVPATTANNSLSEYGVHSSVHIDTLAVLDCDYGPSYPVVVCSSARTTDRQSFGKLKAANG